MRVGVALALAVVGLFEVLSMLQGVRSVRRLRARASARLGATCTSLPNTMAGSSSSSPTAVPSQPTPAGPLSSPPGCRFHRLDTADETAIGYRKVPGLKPLHWDAGSPVHDSDQQPRGCLHWSHP